MGLYISAFEITTDDFNNKNFYKYEYDMKMYLKLQFIY